MLSANHEQHKIPHSAFHEILERLSDEHEREITLLRTEVVELRTQLGVMDPTQKFMDHKTSIIHEAVERWEEERHFGQEKHGHGHGHGHARLGDGGAGGIASVVQQWAEQKRLQVQAENSRGPSPSKSLKFSDEELLREPELFEAPVGDKPPDDWPPPAACHKSERESFLQKAEDNRKMASTHSMKSTHSMLTMSEPLAGDAPEDMVAAVSFSESPPRIHQIVPQVQGSIMESQHQFREQEVRIKHDFEDASRQSNVNGMMDACFKVWSLLTRHMRARFCFQVLEPWRGDGPTSTAAGAMPLTHNMQMKDNPEDMEHAEVVDDNGGVPPPQGLGRLLLAPNATSRSWWDLAGTLLLIWDIVLIPIDAFEPERTDFLASMEYITLCFWTCDIFMSCITGYVHRGVTIMDPKMILRHYLKSFFLVDMVVVGPDWVFLIVRWSTEMETSGSDPAGAGSNRVVRIMRVVRLARLLRLVKLTRGLQMMRDRIESEVMFIVANIMKLILMLLIVNHFLGSCWYLVGNLCRNEGQVNWIQEHHFEGTSFGYRYFSALHWSLTQFTPASMSVQPQNIYERMFAICVLVFGLVLFSSFISSITASMTQLRNMSEDKSKQFWLLRRYLRQRGIDKQLTFRILRYVEYAIKEKTVQVSEAKVWSLGLLSHQLREELQYEVSFKCLMSHPFFERSREVSSMSTFQLAEQALSVEMLASRDTLFNPGTAATHMFIVAYGQLKYLKMDELFLADDSVHPKLAKDDWACEQALWTKWTHLGCLRAISEVRLVAIDVKKFEDVINKDPVAWDLARAYCEKFVAWLNDTPRGSLTDVAHQNDQSGLVRSFLVTRSAKKNRMTTVKAMSLLDAENSITPKKSLARMGKPSRAAPALHMRGSLL